jgi:cyclophilin family peptidyl-prolyl cis-trans isomerase
MSRQIASFRWSTGLVTLALAGGLSACGGGGGDDSPKVTPSAITVTLTASGNAIANLPVQLSATPSGPLGQTVTQSTWQYGDGQSGTTTSHAYSKAGTYTVTYSFTDSQGLKGEGTTKVTVKACSATGLAAAASSPLTTNVCVQTNQGEMVFALDTVQAPVTTTNFLKYVDAGFYSGTLFHRIINGFMAQGGGFKLATDGMIQAATLAPIPLESNNGLQNKAYTLAMARGDAFASATSQFFINFVDNAFLNYRPATSTTPLVPGYAVFGKVIVGQAVVNGLATVATGQGPVVNADGDFLRNLPDVPVTPVVIQGMARIN